MRRIFTLVKSLTAILSNSKRTGTDEVHEASLIPIAIGTIGTSTIPISNRTSASPLRVVSNNTTTMGNKNHIDYNDDLAVAGSFLFNAQKKDNEKKFEEMSVSHDEVNETAHYNFANDDLSLNTYTMKKLNLSIHDSSAPVVSMIDEDKKVFHDSFYFRKPEMNDEAVSKRRKEKNIDHSKFIIHNSSLTTPKNSFMKKLLRRTGIFAITLIVANLFLLSNAVSQTINLYLKNTALNTGANASGNPNVYDLSATQGTAANITTTTGATTTTFIEILAFTITDNQLSGAISSDQFSVSFSVQSTESVNMGYRFRLQRVNSSGVVQASTGYSSTVTGFTTGGPVVTTATLTFSPSQTWASTDRLRLSVEDNNTTSATSRTMTVNTNNANSYVQYKSCVTPTAYGISGGGSYCPGGTGVAVGLALSQSGVNYQLYNNLTPVGAVVAGTGSAISFGLQTTVSSLYNVIATNTVGGCTASMTGTASVSLYTQPIASVGGSTNVLCNGNSDGTITVNASGTAGSYDYGVSTDGGNNFTWYPNPGNPTLPTVFTSATTYTIMGLVANTAYRIKVIDSNGCLSK